jgi:dTDP-4-amino-4,6-dideoxygalactose transaminase
MDIPFFRPCIGEREIDAAIQVLRSGWLTTGPKCAEFEERFAEMLGGGVHAIAVNSATAGLHLAAEACEIAAGDEVLVPTMTFTATAAAFSLLGARVILVDVHPDNLTIDLAEAERKITPRTKAIAPVHFGGWPCDMAAILSFARQHDLRVVEDAAHALPAHRNGRMIGSWNTDACIFSFYANKTITTGEGGMLVTPNPIIAKRARVMRTHGLSREAFDRFSKVGANWAYDIVAPGFKYNMSDLAAAIGVMQLKRAHVFQRQRQRIADQYFDCLSDLPIDCPARAPPGCGHAWHLFPVRVHADAPIGRDDLITLLTRQDIGSSVHYRPLHQMSYWRNSCDVKQGDFPVADRYFEGAVTLPLFPEMHESEVERVSAALHRAFGRAP